MSDTPHDPIQVPLADTEQVDPDGLGEAQLEEERDRLEAEEQGVPDPHDVEEHQLPDERSS